MLQLGLARRLRCLRRQDTGFVNRFAGLPCQCFHVRMLGMGGKQQARWYTLFCFQGSVLCIIWILLTSG